MLDSARYAGTSRDLRGLRWRLVGPFRGGRAVAVVGDQTKPNLFYFGAVNGGVWKTTNAGASWSNITDGRASISSVGAITIAPSDPNVIYVGGGEAGPARGLDVRRRHVSIDRRRSDVDAPRARRRASRSRASSSTRATRTDVFVAAMGHAFGPNAMRGVYRTTDGGKAWQRCCSSTTPPARSTCRWIRAIRACSTRRCGTCSARRGDSRRAATSGLWKSTDGGDTWSELTFNPGLPKNPLGRIGVSVSPANPQRIYATIESPARGFHAAASSAPTTPARRGSERAATSGGWCGRGTTASSPPTRRTRTRCT